MFGFRKKTPTPAQKIAQIVQETVGPVVQRLTTIGVPVQAASDWIAATPPNRVYWKDFGAWRQHMDEYRHMTPPMPSVQLHIVDPREKNPRSEIRVIGGPISAANHLRFKDTYGHLYVVMLWQLSQNYDTDQGTAYLAPYEIWMEVATVVFDCDYGHLTRLCFGGMLPPTEQH